MRWGVKIGSRHGQGALTRKMSFPPKRGDIVYEETLCHIHDASMTRSSEPVLCGLSGRREGRSLRSPASSGSVRGFLGTGSAGTASSGARPRGSAPTTELSWCGCAAAGPMYLATVEDLFSRRLLGFTQSDTYPRLAHTRRVVRLHPRARTRHTPPLPNPRPGPSRHSRLDRYLVQHQTPTLHQQHAQPDRVPSTN